MQKISIIFSSILCIFCLLLTVGCGYKEGVKIEEQKAYLYFTGNTSGAEIIVDGKSFVLGEEVTIDGLFQIEPGQRRIEVKRNGTTVIDRKIYVSDGISREIQIPQP